MKWALIVWAITIGSIMIIFGLHGIEIVCIACALKWVLGAGIISVMLGIGGLLGNKGRALGASGQH